MRNRNRNRLRKLEAKLMPPKEMPPFIVAIEAPPDSPYELIPGCVIAWENGKQLSYCGGEQPEWLSRYWKPQLRSIQILED